MNDKNSERLRNEFPGLYSELQWGFAVDDGWFELIYELSRFIVRNDPACRAHQIKEKFGMLRYYTGPTSEHIHEKIAETENESAKICEKCGSRDTVSTAPVRGWYLTLCDDCRTRTEKEIEERAERWRDERGRE